MVTVCESAGCRKPYQVNEYSAHFIIGSETGRIICPHCGTITRGRDTSVYLTHAVLPDGDPRASDGLQPG